MILKRILPIFLIICLLLSGFACDSKNGQGENPITDFSVSFIDVGQGDCSFISFGDGKCMLIDTGNKNYEYSLKIIKFIKNLGFSKIDYLVLTHPDLDHIGNANSIINVFPISQVFLPYILDFSLLAEYKSVVENLSLKQVKMQTSKMFNIIEGENYFLMFLSPSPYENSDSSYFDYNIQTLPSAQATNDLSPIIYLEYLDTRFVFTGDAGFSQEQLVIKNYKANLYNTSLTGNKINLNNIDFLKLGHHGSTDSSSQEFLSLLAPKNAVICVGGNNNFGHPSLITLAKLLEVNNDCGIYRTDLNGNISICVDKFSVQTIKLQFAG